MTNKLLHPFRLYTHETVRLQNGRYEITKTNREDIILYLPLLPTIENLPGLEMIFPISQPNLIKPIGDPSSSIIYELYHKTPEGEEILVGDLCPTWECAPESSLY